LIVKVSAGLVEPRGVGPVDLKPPRDCLREVLENFAEGEPLLTLKIEVNGAEAALLLQPARSLVEHGGLANAPLAVEHDDVLLFGLEDVLDEVEDLLPPVKRGVAGERHADHVGVPVEHRALPVPSLVAGE